MSLNREIYIELIDRANIKFHDPEYMSENNHPTYEDCLRAVSEEIKVSAVSNKWAGTPPKFLQQTYQPKAIIRAVENGMTELKKAPHHRNLFEKKI